MAAAAPAAATVVGVDEADEGEQEGEGEEDWDEAARREEDAAQAAILGARKAAEAVAIGFEKVTSARPTTEGHRGEGHRGGGWRGIGAEGGGEAAGLHPPG